MSEDENMESGNDEVETEEKSGKPEVDYNAVVQEYAKRFKVTPAEAKKRLDAAFRKGPDNTPSLENIFPQPLGPVSKRILDMNQAVMSTRIMRQKLKDLDNPPAEIEDLKETVNQLTKYVMDRVGNIESILDERQRQDERKKLVDEVVQQLKPTLDQLKPPQGQPGTPGTPPTGQPMQFSSMDDVVTWLTTQEEAAKKLLEAKGLRVVGGTVTVGEKSIEAMRTDLESAGFKVEDQRMTREQFEQRTKELYEKWRKEEGREIQLEIERVAAVKEIVMKVVDRAVDTVLEPAKDALHQVIDIQRKARAAAATPPPTAETSPPTVDSKKREVRTM